MSRLLLAPSVFLALFVQSCQRIPEGLPRPDLSNRKVRVVATTGMIADIVKEVGGEHVELECLLGPGGDPHKYYPTPGDLEKIEHADLVFYNGLDLEAKMGDVFEKKSKRMRMVAVSNKIDRAELRQPEPGFEGTYDPHIWFDVKLWIKAVDAVEEALADVDPNHAASYAERAKAYRTKLEALDEEVKQMAAKVPVSKRVIITAHDAFGYFGRAYGFEVKGLQGTSTATQTDIHAVQELVRLIGTRQIPVIFGETSVPDEGIRAVLEAVGKQYPNVKVALSDARLYSDAPGEPGTEDGTYIGMVRHNVRALVDGLSK